MPSLEPIMRRTFLRRALPRAFAGLLALSLPTPRLRAADDPGATLFVHGQTTYVLQGHGAFPSPYAGPASFASRREVAGSFSATLCLGWRPWTGGEVVVTPELLGGKGDSRVQGLAGAPNGEIYRVSDPKVAPNLSRVFLRQTWALPGAGAREAEGGPLAFGGSRPSRRLTLTAGKMAMNDLFDLNGWAGDPRTAFLNWSFMDTAAWDYPADTRGYSWGLVAEVAWEAWSVRLGSFLEPRAANQMAFDHQVSRAHGDVLEVGREHRWGDLPGRVAVLVFANHARMGVYRDALALTPPAVDATRAPGRTKSGAGLNVEQDLAEGTGVFLRAGWNDGRTESWAFTEADRSLAAGLSAAGKAWHRPQDRLGVAFAANGLSRDHAAYLAQGGQGFLLGDGRLAEGAERILEAFYALALAPGITVTGDAQRLWNPGMNRARGPVQVFALRVHGAF